VHGYGDGVGWVAVVVCGGCAVGDAVVADFVAGEVAGVGGVGVVCGAGAAIVDFDFYDDVFVFDVVFVGAGAGEFGAGEFAAVVGESACFGSGSGGGEGLLAF
jgi:hypothetical protein